MAKEMIWDLSIEYLPPQEIFPLKPVAVFTGQENMTSDTAESLRFWSHLKLAQASIQRATRCTTVVSTVDSQTGLGSVRNKRDTGQIH